MELAGWGKKRRKPTSSFRRKAQLNILRNDINIVSMRGNVDTRINKLKNKEFDAIVLSLAGLKMLNLENEVKEVFSDEQILPAVGQGAIALQCRIDDKKTLNISFLIGYFWGINPLYRATRFSALGGLLFLGHE